MIRNSFIETLWTRVHDTQDTVSEIRVVCLALRAAAQWKRFAENQNSSMTDLPVVESYHDIPVIASLSARWLLRRRRRARCCLSPRILLARAGTEGEVEAEAEAEAEAKAEAEAEGQCENFLLIQLINNQSK